MKEWIEQYVKSLVQSPDAVSISLSEGIKTVILTIKVAESDLARFDGRNNRLTRSLTKVAGLAGAKDRMRYILKFSV